MTTSRARIEIYLLKEGYGCQNTLNIETKVVGDLQRPTFGALRETIIFLAFIIKAIKITIQLIKTLISYVFVPFYFFFCSKIVNY